MRRWRTGPAAQSYMDAVVEGSVARLRPKLMTVATTVLGLLPIMLATGSGMDITKPIATPTFGGMISSTIYVLFLIPVSVCDRRRHPAALAGAIRRATLHPREMAGERAVTAEGLDAARGCFLGLCALLAACGGSGDRASTDPLAAAAPAAASSQPAAGQGVAIQFMSTPDPPEPGTIRLR